MLDIIFTTTRMLLLPLITPIYWHISILVLILITLKIFTLFNVSSLVRISSILIIDQISSTLILLSVWITALIILARYKVFHIKNIPKLFTSVCTLLLLTLIISFSASSIVIFYIAFEASLIPTMILIILWGYQPERLQARIYLIVYTITASLPLLIIIIKIYFNSKHLNITIPEQITIPISSFNSLTWLILITAFIVKLPLFSVHLWLPKAHVEAPVAGSIILAAILLKLGGYGLARIIIIFRYINKTLVNPVISIAIVGGVVTSIICLRQSDIKSIIAYSSVGHIGLIVAGMLTNSKLGLQASLSIIIAHGLRSSALFCIANIRYNITQTRRIILTKGFLTVIPILSLWWFIFCCANIAAPPRINLIREIFLIISIIRHSLWIIIPLRIIRFITVAYSLYLYATTNHGPTINISAPIPQIRSSDINLLTLHLVPIVILILKPEIIISWC